MRQNYYIDRNTKWDIKYFKKKARNIRAIRKDKKISKYNHNNEEMKL